MAITIYSPHSGRPVMVREQDVGRAVRDDSGRVFYVLQKQDGGGHYGSRTRIGGAEQEQHAAAMAAAPAPAPAEAEVQDRPSVQVHDARGRGRPGRWRRVVILVLLLVAASAAGYYAWQTYGHHVFDLDPADPVNPAPSRPVQPADVSQDAAPDSKLPPSP